MWTLAKEILELRFANEFLYWDKTGLIARRICQLVPTLKLENAAVGTANLVDDDNQIRVRYGHSILNLSQDVDPPPTVKLFDVSSEIVEFVLREMDVSSVLRVGHRMHVVRKFPSREKAEEFVTGVTRKRGLGADLFVNSDDWLKAKPLRAASLRFEDDKIGIRIELSSGKTGFEVDGPVGKHVRKYLPEPEFISLLDVDVYTLNSMLPEGLNVSALRQSNLKLVKSRLEPLFET